MVIEQYTYRRIKDLYKEGMSKIKEGNNISSFDTKLYTMYGYALDMIETSRLAESYLSLDIRTNKDIGRTIMFIYQSNLKKRIALEEMKKDLIKKISAFELLWHYNFCLETGFMKPEFYEEKEFLSLKITSEKKTYKLNVCNLVSECVYKDFLFDKDITIVLSNEHFKANDVEGAIAIKLSRLYNEFSKILKDIIK